MHFQLGFPPGCHALNLRWCSWPSGTLSSTYAHRVLVRTMMMGAGHVTRFLLHWCITFPFTALSRTFTTLSHFPSMFAFVRLLSTLWISNRSNKWEFCVSTTESSGIIEGGNLFWFHLKLIKSPHQQVAVGRLEGCVNGGDNATIVVAAANFSSAAPVFLIDVSVS